MGFLTILLALLVFGVLIFIHELGHFLAARACGVAINEFAIGMGPKILSWKSKKYDTRYALRLFPIGGFVSMVGEDEASDDERAFINKNVWQKIAIIVAGPVMNILLGFILMFILVAGSSQLGSTTVAGFSDEAVSPSYGLAAGDTILKVDGVRVHTANDLVYEIMNSGYQSIDLTVLRDDEKVLLEDVTFPTFTESGVTFGNVDFTLYEAPKTLGNVIKHAFFRSLSTVKMIWDSLISLLTGRYGMDAVSGPVGITKEIGEAAGQGIGYFLYVFVVISMNLGVFNLLPVPALDGGRLFFRIVEVFRGGKPIKQEWEAYIHAAGIMILLAIMLLVTFKDVIGLFK